MDAMPTPADTGSLAPERVPSVRRWVRPAYAAQAVLVTCWWGLLAAVPVARDPFLPAGIPWEVFRLCVIADLVILVPASALAAWRPVPGLRLLVLGAVAWPTALCVAWSWSLGGGELGAVAMVLLLVQTCALAAEAHLFRIAKAGRPVRHLVLTAGQIVGFWGVFLGVLPALIARLDPWRSPDVWAAAAGWGLFAAASCLGLASAWIMARQGAGTPLPVAAPARLVVAGPYRWVRNPMALAGILQGLGVALALGSPLVAGYALAGAVAWHALARPDEEQDLTARFGESYRAYRARVPLWLPRPPR
jgi:protein-S-isoprenylcysteine O-methyltransferase Ste14